MASIMKKVKLSHAFYFMPTFECSVGSYHKYECGREDVYESTMARILQHGQNKAEGVKKVHRLALKVWNASTNHGLHSSAQAEKGLYSQKVSSPCSEGKECFYKP
jgi:hypothetical protein